MAISTLDRQRLVATGDRTRQALPFVLVGWLGAVCAYIYGVVVVQPGWDLAATMHAQIVDGTAASPYRSRILLPFVADALSRVLPLESAYLALYFVLFPLALCTLFALLRRWHRPSIALLGTVIAAAIMPLALRDHFYQPGTWLELVLVTTALHLLAQRRLDLRAYAAISLVAALNRETGMLLGLLLLVVAWRSYDGARSRLVVIAFVPVAVYGMVRLWRGGGPPAEHDLLTRNLHDIPTAAVQLTLFGAVLVYLLVAAWPVAPALLRRAMCVVPPYLVLVAAFGIWRETRLLVPLLPIVIGIGLGALAGIDDGREPSSGPTTAP